MRMKNKSIYFIATVCLLTILFASQTFLPLSAVGKEKLLRVAAAADLNVAFKEIGEVFEKKTGTKVDFIFGSTGTLAQQIENGAPFDVFAAANIKFVDDLKAKKLIIPDTQQLYAQGRVGIATPIHSSLEVKTLQDFLNPKVKKIAIANPEHAPYGTAAKEALEKAGLWEKVKGKMVYGKNIAETLTLINTGNADTGVIALSIYDKNKVKFHLINDQSHNPLNQSMAVVRKTKMELEARKFVRFVNSAEGRAIMKKYGFILPGEGN